MQVQKFWVKIDILQIYIRETEYFILLMFKYRVHGNIISKLKGEN
jgi:hypothetical protein